MARGIGPRYPKYSHYGANRAVEREKKTNPRDRRRGDPARQDAAEDAPATARWRCSIRNRARRWQAGSRSPPISTARRSSWCRRCRSTPARSTPTRAARCCSASPARAIRWRIRASAYAAGPSGWSAARRSRSRAERRYLNRHPKARLYAGFGDFAFFRLAVGARQPQWRLRQGLSPGARPISCSTVRQTTSSPTPSSRRSTT